VLVGSAAMAQHGVVLLLLGPVLPDLMRDFAMREGLAGVMLSIGSLGFTLGPLVVGRLVDRSGVRLAFLLGFVIELVALVLFGFVSAFVLAVVGNFILRFGASFVETAVNVLPVTLQKATGGGDQDEGRNASLMNLMHTFFGVGALLIPVIAGAIVQATGTWRGAFYFGAAVTALMLAAAWVSVPRPDGPRPGALSAEGPAPAAAPAGAPGLADTLRHPLVLAGAFALFVYVGAEAGTSAWVVLYLRQKFALSPVASGTGLTLFWVGITAGRSVNSLLASRVSVRTLVLGAAVLGAAFAASLAVAPTPALALVLLALFGFAISGTFPNVMVSVNSLFPDRVGRTTAVLTLAAAAGAMSLHPVIGGLAQVFGISAVVAVPPVLLVLLAAVYGPVTARYRAAAGRAAA
jgi:MFS transporter, FHS family, glucose/mannose:H+ symporter